MMGLAASGTISMSQIQAVSNGIAKKVSQIFDGDLELSDEQKYNNTEYSSDAIQMLQQLGCSVEQNGISLVQHFF